jgi:hypothetical protein
MPNSTTDIMKSGAAILVVSQGWWKMTEAA